MEEEEEGRESASLISELMERLMYRRRMEVSMGNRLRINGGRMRINVEAEDVL